MNALSSISQVVVHSHYDTPVPSFTNAATSTHSLTNPRFTSSQSRQLVTILNHIDKLENALKTSRLKPTRTLVDSIDTNAFVKSTLLAGQPDISISQQTVPENFVVNGSFEDDVINRRFSNTPNVTGWRNTNGSLEVWRNHMPPAHGNQNVELDVSGLTSRDTLEQTVATVPGQIYEFSFAFSARPRVDAAANSFEVYFDGTKLGTIEVDGSNLSKPDWNMYSFSLAATSTQATILFRETSSPSSGGGALLDTVSLVETTRAAGVSSVREISNNDSPTLLSGAGIASGSFSINDKVINIDIENQSLQDVADSINSAATGVTASLVSTGKVTPENQQLFSLQLTTSDNSFSIADNDTGFLAALGIKEGLYGEVYETSTHAGKKMRGYRAANALEEIQASMQTLFEAPSTTGSLSLKSALGSIVDNLLERYGKEKLSAIGLDLAELKEHFIDISKQSRRRFAKAVYERENLLERLFLKTNDPNEYGLIEALRATIEAEIQTGGRPTGGLVSTLA